MSADTSLQPDPSSWKISTDIVSLYVLSSDAEILEQDLLFVYIASSASVF